MLIDPSLETQYYIEKEPFLLLEIMFRLGSWVVLIPISIYPVPMQQISLCVKKRFMYG